MKMWRHVQTAATSHCPVDCSAMIVVYIHSFTSSHCQVTPVQTPPHILIHCNKAVLFAPPFGWSDSRTPEKQRATAAISPEKFVWRPLTANRGDVTARREFFPDSPRSPCGGCDDASCRRARFYLIFFGVFFVGSVNFYMCLYWGMACSYRRNFNQHFKHGWQGRQRMNHSWYMKIKKYGHNCRSITIDLHLAQ